MGRPKRAADGGLVYHVLNRANARMGLFEKPEDYEAFEVVLAEAIERTQTRLSLRRAQSIARRTGAARRRLALEQPLSLEAWHGEGEVAAGVLATTASAGLGRPRRRAADRGGTEATATVGQPRVPVRRTSLVRSNGASPATPEHPPPPRPTKEGQKRFLTPFPH